MAALETAAVFEEGMPAAPAIENAVIGDCMRTASTRSIAFSMLTEEDFSTRAKLLAFRAIKALDEEGWEPIPTTVAQRLMDKGEIEAAGGLSTIADYGNLALTKDTAIRYCRLLKGKTARRILLEATNDLCGLVVKGEFSDVEERLEAMLATIRQRTGKDKQGKSASDVIAEAGGIHKFVGGDPEPSIGLPWKEELKGLRPGELTVLGARPSVGKSAAASHITGVACLDGHRVHYWSLEMGATAVLRRVVSALLSLKGSDYRDRNVSIEQEGHIVDLAKRLDDTLRIMDGSKAGPRDIEKHIEADYKQGRCPKLVVVDYLQLMSGLGANRTEEISKITRGLKVLTLRYPVAILLLSQLSRDCEKFAREPILSDLRDSGSIEHDADNVVLLHRVTVSIDADEVKWTVAKQRDGKTGSTHLILHKNVSQLTNF